MAEKTASLRIVRMSLSDIKPHPRNPRSHPDPGTPQWEILKKSLDHDYFDPLVVNERNGMLVSGHLRHKVLQDMEFTHADCSIVDYDEPTHYARLIAANELLGQWEKEILAALAGDINAAGLENGDGSVSSAQLTQWAELYGTQPRQLRRWIRRGKEKNDPCPLDNPVAMPAWVDLHLIKIRGDLRDRVLAAATAACSKNPDSSEPSNTATVEPCSKTEQSTAAPRTTPELPKVQSFDLASVGGVEGELVDFFRQVVAATKIQLQDAYKDGTEARIAALLKRIESTGESLRKQEAAAEVKAKRRGDLMSKAEVYETWMELIKMFSILREQRRRRMRAELSARPELINLPPETIEAILNSVDVVTTEEEKIFQNMGSIKSADDILFQLAA